MGREPGRPGRRRQDRNWPEDRKNAAIFRTDVGIGYIDIRKEARELLTRVTAPNLTIAYSSILGGVAGRVKPANHLSLWIPAATAGMQEFRLEPFHRRGRGGVLNFQF